MDATVIPHFYETLPGWCDFEDIYREAVERAPDDRPSTFIELGTYCGRSLAYLAVEIVNSGKPIVAWSFDTWERFDKQMGREEVRARFDAAGVSSRVSMMCSDSATAAELFKDGEVDFVFIDADHEYKSVALDIVSWWPKIKRGGVMALHDYWPPGTIPAGALNPVGFPGVVRAVHEFSNRESVLVKRQGTSAVILKP